MYLEINYTPLFIRQYNKLDTDLQDEVVEKIEFFKDKENHDKLRVHALKGKMQGYFSFSVNYSHRVVFEYLNKKEVALLKVGDHDIYK